MPNSFYKLIISTPQIKNNKEALFTKDRQEYAQNPYGVFSKFSLNDKIKFLVSQSILFKYLTFSQNYTTPTEFKELQNLYNQCLNKIREEYKNTTDDIQKSVIKKAIDIIDYFLLNRKTSVGINYRDIQYFLNQISSKEYFNVINAGKCSSNFYEAFLNYILLIDSNVQININDAVYSNVSIAIPSFYSRYIVIEEISTLPTFKINASRIQNNPGFAKSFFGFISCFDFTNMSLDTVFVLLSNFAFSIDFNYCMGDPMLEFYRALKLIITNFKLNIDNTRGMNYASTSWFAQKIKTLIEVLKTDYNIKIKDPVLLGRIISGDGYNKNTELLNDYLEKLKTPSEINVEAYKAFKNSVLSVFEELDLESNNFGLEAEEDVPDDTGTDDTPEDDPAADDVGGDDTGDDSTADSTDEGEDTGDDSTTDDQTNNQPTKPELNTSDKSGIKFELAKEETFDSLVFRQEVSHYIDALIQKQDLTIEQIAILKKLKTYWLNLLSVQTIMNILDSIHVKQANK